VAGEISESHIKFKVAVEVSGCQTRSVSAI
jgi:hypothetical protein